jgi:hypothetical protein
MSLSIGDNPCWSGALRCKTAITVSLSFVIKPFLCRPVLPYWPEDLLLSLRLYLGRDAVMLIHPLYPTPPSCNTPPLHVISLQPGSNHRLQPLVLTRVFAI